MTELQAELLLRQAARIEVLEADLAEAERVNTSLFTDYCSRVEALEAALREIVTECEDTPHSMRHVVEIFGKIATAALAPEQDK